MQQPRYRGAPPGVIPGLLMSLHTWGRTLSHHPHVHCLLSAGGIDATGLWRDMPSNWIMPVRALQALLRGKLLGALGQAIKHGRWVLPPELTAELWRQQLHALWRKHWNVEIRGPYDHGRGVVLYLARYAKGAPVPPHRFLDLLEDAEAPELRMPYLDHRSGQQRTLQLSVDEFISRVLWHAPARGVHTTRHAGLYTAAHRLHHQTAQRHLRLCSDEHSWPRPSPSPAASPTLCPHCNQPMLRGRVLMPDHSRTRMRMHRPGESSPRHRFNGSLRPTRGPTGRSTPDPLRQAT
jgi:Putative transposase